MTTKTIGWNHPVDDADQWDGFNDSGIEHFTGSPVRHLAREVNQNSFDSGEGATVRVTMRLVEVDVDSIPNVDQMKQTIELCLVAAGTESEKALQFFTTASEELKRPKISVLEITDYNTRGMRGPSVNGSPFYAFMKAKGQSRKDSKTATGSFGIGKFAPYAVSKLRTVFISTVFEGDDGTLQQLTQGKSILMSHDDHSGGRRQGAGFWGHVDRCQPIEGVNDDLPAWIQRTTDKSNLKESKGSKLTILGFDAIPGWQENLIASIAENFFGAISTGKLEVDVNGAYHLDKHSIAEVFGNLTVRTEIATHKNEPEQFDNCGKYLKALEEGPEVIEEESERPALGLCQLRILLGEGLPKKVCMLRNGMFISDSLSLPGLKNFSDFKEFVAVVECKTKKGIEFLRAMEPPRHDDFEPERLPSKEEQKKATRALKELAGWIREMLKRHAKDPVSEVTTLDELKDYFPDESGAGAGKGTEEIDPNGKIIIRAKPLKPKAPTSNAAEDVSGGSEEGDQADGGGGKDGEGGGDGNGGSGAGDGGTSSESSSSSTKPIVAIENVRAITDGGKKRRVWFTPTADGQVALGVMSAGADVDYGLQIATSNVGTIKDGKVILDVVAKSRIALQIDLSDEFKGALKVVAHEV